MAERMVGDVVLDILLRMMGDIGCGWIFYVISLTSMEDVKERCEREVPKV